MSSPEVWRSVWTSKRISSSSTSCSLLNSWFTEVEQDGRWTAAFMSERATGWKGERVGGSFGWFSGKKSQTQIDWTRHWTKKNTDEPSTGGCILSERITKAWKQPCGKNRVQDQMMNDGGQVLLRSIDISQFVCCYTFVITKMILPPSGHFYIWSQFLGELKEKISFQCMIASPLWTVVFYCVLNRGQARHL